MCTPVLEQINVSQHKTKGPLHAAPVNFQLLQNFYENITFKGIYPEESRLFHSFHKVTILKKDFYGLSLYSGLVDVQQSVNSASR